MKAVDEIESLYVRIGFAGYINMTGSTVNLSFHANIFDIKMPAYHSRLLFHGNNTAFQENIYL